MKHLKAKESMLPQATMYAFLLSQKQRCCRTHIRHAYNELCFSYCSFALYQGSKVAGRHGRALQDHSLLGRHLISIKTLTTA